MQLIYFDEIFSCHLQTYLLGGVFIAFLDVSHLNVDIYFNSMKKYSEMRLEKIIRTDCSSLLLWLLNEMF